MLVLLVCGVLLLAAIAIVVFWGGSSFTDPPSTATGVRYYLWWATLFSVSAFGSAILVATAGGRLVMRVLALTSPRVAGRLTEAGAAIDSITVDGTISLFIFGALPFGLLSAAFYLIVRPWLPRGRWGGLTYGVLLLVLFATTLDPLRAENFDFDILDPGWLAVLMFSAAVILHGALVATLACWYSSRLPQTSSRQWWPYAPLIAPVVIFPIGIMLAVGAGVSALVPRALPAVMRWLSSRIVVIAGRILLALALILTAPGFIGSVISIIDPSND